MYQQSVDRSGGSQKSDLILFIVLIIAFFAVGAVVMYLEKLFDSNVPRYVFIGLVLAAIYAIYRLRIIGFRYTVFYKEPETVYDPRFDDMITHEDYPYPVGTIVFERIVSAKGTTIETLCGGAFGRPAALYVRAHPPGDRPSPLPAIARLCRH